MDAAKRVERTLRFPAAMGYSNSDRGFKGLFRLMVRFDPILSGRNNCIIRAAWIAVETFLGDRSCVRAADGGESDAPRLAKSRARVALSTIATEVARAGAQCAPADRSQLWRAMNRTCSGTLAQSMQ